MGYVVTYQLNLRSIVKLLEKMKVSVISYCYYGKLIKADCKPTIKSMYTHWIFSM